MKIAYIVSRFPIASETFIVRELNALVTEPEPEVLLFSLFPARESFLHPAAAPWLPGLHRPTPAASVGALAWWLCRHPIRLVTVTAAIARAHWRRPRFLVRALATVLVGAALARTLSRLGVDHVHAHFASYPTLAAWVCRRLAGIPYSFTAHAHDIFIDQSFLDRKLDDARFAVAISEYNRAYLGRYVRRPGVPVHVVHSGVEPSYYRYRLREPPAAGPVRALCVATLEEYKGHEVLLEAITGGDGCLRRVELDLVGAGSLRSSLEASATARGLGDRVRFRGTLAERQVAELLEQADVFVLPSLLTGTGRMEGLPVALIEALASGVPVVATNLSGVPELVHDGETGLLAEPGNPASLRKQLARTLDDPASARRRAEAGRRLVEAEFDIERSAGELRQLFLAGAEGPRTRAS